MRNNTSSKIAYLILKRLFDICLSFVMTLILMIPMLLISIVIMTYDFGSPFFMHKRVGKDGKVIGVLKFRSMKKGSEKLEDSLTDEQLEEYKREFKLRDDPRLIGYREGKDSCFGSRLRKMSIDEIPQIFWNILLLGNMSFVGPRPLLEEELKLNYSEADQEKFTSVKPGLTGYWQAYARNNVGYYNGKRQAMELYYIDNRSFILDIRILFKTVSTVIKKEGSM